MDPIYEILKEMKEIMEENRDMLKKIVNSIETREKQSYKTESDVGIDIDNLEEFDVDSLFSDAMEYMIETNRTSIPFLMRKFEIGYSRAYRIVELAENLKLISEYEKGKQSEVLVSKEQWETIKKQLKEKGLIK